MNMSNLELWYMMLRRMPVEVLVRMPALPDDVRERARLAKQVCSIRDIHILADEILVS